MADTTPLDIASLSHPGMVRAHNEDTVFADGDAGIAVLADGMGGYSAGEVASGIAQAGLQTGVPVVFGVVTADTIDQAIDRAGVKLGNKGFEAATTAVELVNLYKTVFGER